MNQTHRLPAELDAHELASLQRFIAAIREESQPGNPTIDVCHIFRGLEGQIYVPVTVSGKNPHVHVAMLMEHKAEQLYKQSGCRFVVAHRLQDDPQRQSYVWAEGAWRTVP
jgi:hypothetical protein